MRQNDHKLHIVLLNLKPNMSRITENTVPFVLVVGLCLLLLGALDLIIATGFRSGIFSRTSQLSSGEELSNDRHKLDSFEIYGSWCKVED